MSQHSISQEISFHPEPHSSTSRIWKVFWVLLGITLVELAFGVWIYFMHKDANPSHGLILALKGAIVILSLAKAYYIVSVFMHLGDEIRNFIMTIVVPLILFVWFIIAFLWDGASWRNLRNTDGGSRKYVPQTEQHQHTAPAVKPDDKK